MPFFGLYDHPADDEPTVFESTEWPLVPMVDPVLALLWALRKGKERAASLQAERRQENAGRQ